MKKSVISSWQLFAMAGALLLIFISCNKQQLPPREDMALNESLVIHEEAGLKQIGDFAVVNPFNKSVGAPINGELGNNWIKNYVNKNGKAKSYTLKTSYLKTILTNPSCVGICMYYAKNLLGEIIIIPVGVNAQGKVIPSFIIPTEKGIVLWPTAKKWIFNYSGSNSGTVAGHFFGANSAFPRLYLQSCETIRADFAIDEYGRPQLLLSNTCILSLTKVYEDRTFPCNTESPTFL